MSSIFLPAFFSSFGIAYTGPMPISSGSHPATAKPRKIPIGLSPLLAATLSLISTWADAPSENWLALPAAMTPPSMAGLICDTPSYVVSTRMPSSSLAVTCLVDSWPVFLSTIFIVVVIGTISSFVLPAARAAAARCWLSAP